LSDANIVKKIAHKIGVSKIVLAKEGEKKKLVLYDKEGNVLGEGFKDLRKLLRGQEHAVCKVEEGKAHCKIIDNIGEVEVEVKL